MERKLYNCINLKKYTHRWKRVLGKFEKALLMAFDPYTNEEIMEVLRQGSDEALSSDFLMNYYKIPVMCMLRIKKSIDTFEKHTGSDGYFDFIEANMGSQIQGEEMKYSILMMPE